MKLTPTEQRIMEALSDQSSHRKEDLLLLLNDDLSEGSLCTHIYNLRKKLNPVGKEITVTKRNGVTAYRMARFVEID